MKARLILLASLFPLLSACTVVRTAVAKSDAARSFDCAAGALNGMGYAIVYADHDLGVLRGERSRASESALFTRNNGDRIVVIVTALRNDQARIVARGETFFMRPPRAR